MCTLTQYFVGKQDENNLILMMSKECLLNNKQSWPYLLKKEISLASMLIKITQNIFYQL